MAQATADSSTTSAGVADDVPNGRLPSRFVAAGKLAEDERAGPRQHSALGELGQQAVDPVRALAHVLEEQDGATRHVQRPGGAEQRGQLGQRASDDRPCGFARLERLQAGRREGAERLGARDRPEEGCLVIGRRASRQPALDHRPMNRHDAQRVKPAVQRRDIAVADQELPRLARGGAVEQREQLLAAVPPAHRDQRGDGRVAPGVVHHPGAQLGRTGLEALAGPDGLVHDRLEAETAQFGDARIEIRGLERTGRGHQRDPVAGPQPSGADHR